MTAIKNALRLNELGQARISVQGLALFRILFGLLMFGLVVRYFAYGWIDDYFIKPQFFFNYYGFAWVRPWPGPWMHVHFGVMGLLALCIAGGLFYRMSMIGFTALFTYFFLLDVTVYLNHYYLVCLVSLLMCFMPAGRAWSLDVLRRPEIRISNVPALYIYLLRFQFCIVYFYGGIAKLNADWLLHAQPLRIWLTGRTDLLLVGPLLAFPATACFLAWAGMLFDLSIPFLLWKRSTRNGAFLLLVVFHLSTRMLFPIGMFPWLMIAGATLFVADAWLRAGKMEAKPQPVQVPGPGRLMQTFIVAYVSLQVLIPLRFVLYPGDLRWTEQGFRFAWRVMAMQKNGLAEFTAGNRILNPAQYLTPFQVQQMSTQPDLILNFAHYLGNKYGGPVHARVRVSLNGRPNRLLIDPHTDLTGVKDGFSAKTWIMPFTKSDGPVRRESAGAERVDSARPLVPRNEAYR